MGRSVTTVDNLPVSTLINSEVGVNENRFLTFVDSEEGFNSLKVNDGIRYNTLTKTLVVDNITADVQGNTATADRLSTPRSISLGGDLQGTVLFDGTEDVTISATVDINSVALGDDTTGDYVKSVSTTDIHLTITGDGESADVIIESNSTPELLPNTIVARDSSGDVKVNVAEAQVLKTETATVESTVVVLNDTTDSQAIDNLTTGTFESAEYTIQATHPTLGKQISKLNVLFDDIDADSVEYGIVFTQAKLVDFTVFYSGSTIQVIADPQVSDLTIKYVKQTIV